MSNSQPQANHGQSRCPTDDQKRIAAENHSLDRYDPKENTTQPVTFTPISGSETLKYDFLRSRQEVSNVLSFSLAGSSPVRANEIEAAFVGNLVRADNQAVFPIAKYAPSQAYIVPWVRPDGRLVEFHVCIDPQQPYEPPPGRYIGTIAWSTPKINVTRQPLVAPGQEQVILRLQYRQQPLIWLWGALAIIAGIAIKLINDGQARGSSGSGSRDGDGDGGGPSAIVATTASRVGQSPTSLLISIAVSAVVGGGALVKGYYGNPEFAADLGGDLWTLIAAVFAATVAAHASIGALQGRS
jgi:hypothetical protein